LQNERDDSIEVLGRGTDGGGNADAAALSSLSIPFVSMRQGVTEVDSFARPRACDRNSSTYGQVRRGTSSDALTRVFGNALSDPEARTMTASLFRSFTIIALTTALAATTLLRPAQAQGQTTQSAIVMIQNYSFMPATLTVPIGTTVTWTNMDGVVHTTTSDSGAWNSGPLNPGASFQHMFATPGTFTYHCMIHPFMHGTIVVQGAGTHPTTSTSRMLTITPNPVPVGSTAMVQGAGFTSNSQAFVFWRRPDGTTRGISTMTGPSGTFSFRLAFAPLHGIGTELVAAFDAATRTWTPVSSVSVVARGTGSGMLAASVNPVRIGGTTTIVGQGFSPGSIAVVQWHRPDGTLNTVRIRTTTAGAFAFTLLADPNHGCGARAFTALDTTTLLAAGPFSLGETC
jgi:plastocyanin